VETRQSGEQISVATGEPKKGGKESFEKSEKTTGESKRICQKKGRERGANQQKAPKVGRGVNRLKGLKGQDSLVRGLVLDGGQGQRRDARAKLK